MEKLLDADWKELSNIFIAGFLIYAGLIILLRISGKRTLSKWNAFDFVVTIALGSTLATGLLNKSVSVFEALVALGTLVILQFIATWLSVRSSFLHQLLKSKPAIIFRDGDFLDEQMKKSRVAKSEVLAAIRSKGHGSMADIAVVILETDGTFSVIKNFPADVKDSTWVNVEGFSKGAKS